MHCEPDWWFWYENCFQCLGIESTSMASDSDIGTPILALKNHERPKKVIKANEGQKSPKFQKPVILSIFNAKQSINANVLLENVDFYLKDYTISQVIPGNYNT